MVLRILRIRDSGLGSGDAKFMLIENRDAFKVMRVEASHAV